MQQKTHLDTRLKEEIVTLEKEIEKIALELQLLFQKDFTIQGKQLIIELIRQRKGRKAVSSEVFEEGYRSFIEIGIEQGDEYFPNDYIPVWKCSNEWFQLIGYLTKYGVEGIRFKLIETVKEILEDRHHH